MVLQLTSNNQAVLDPTPQHAQQLPIQTQRTEFYLPNPTRSRLAALETQLAELRKQNEQDPADIREPRALGMYDPSLPLFPHESESASTIAASVEVLFLGVERSTLVQIIEIDSSQQISTGFWLAKRSGLRRNAQLALEESSSSRPKGMAEKASIESTASSKPGRPTPGSW